MRPMLLIALCSLLAIVPLVTQGGETSLAQNAPAENPYLAKFNPLYAFDGVQLDGSAEEPAQLEELADLRLIEEAGAYALREGKVPESETLARMRDGIKTQYAMALRTMRAADEMLTARAKKLGIPIAELRAVYRNHVANHDGSENGDAIYIRNHQKASSIAPLVDQALRVTEARILARQFVAARKK